jgi:primosomal protein N'
MTEEQEAVVLAVSDAVYRNKEEHFVLEAVAGSGKTSTLVSIVERILRDVPRL